MSNLLKLSSQNFQAEVSNFSGVVLVDFYADWCGPCRLIAPEIELLSQEFAENANVKIAKVDVDANPDLAMQYNIQGIPNVIIFKAGQIAKQIVGIPRQESQSGLSKSPRAIYREIIEELLK